MYSQLRWGFQYPRVKDRVVLSDVLGGKDVVEGRDGRTVGFVY
jgi:hypothetical protein